MRTPLVTSQLLVNLCPCCSASLLLLSDLLAMNPKLREEHFVRTNDGTGLTRENAEQVIQKLRRLREQRSSTRDHERDGASPLAP